VDVWGEDNFFYNLTLDSIVSYRYYFSVLERIRILVKRHRLLFSGKAAQQLLDGAWTVEDFIHSILHGRVVKRTKDESGVARYKYVVVGPAIDGDPLYSCGKIVERGGQAYFVITFHEAR